MTNQKPIKVVLVGDGRVGKTSFVHRHRIGEIDDQYKATMGVEVHPLKFHTNHGPIVFNVWDCAGQEKFGGMKEGYYIKAKCAIVMFDHQKLLTLKNTTKWQDDVMAVVGDKPMVLVGNKNDLCQKTPSDSQQQGYLDYHTISAKTNYGYDMPFLTLAKHFLGEDTVFLTDDIL